MEFANSGLSKLGGSQDSRKTLPLPPTPRLFGHLAQRELEWEWKVYLAWGYALASPTLIVGDDGLIAIDPPDSMEATKKAWDDLVRGGRYRQAGQGHHLHP